MDRGLGADKEKKKLRRDDEKGEKGRNKTSEDVLTPRLLQGVEKRND